MKLLTLFKVFTYGIIVLIGMWTGISCLAQAAPKSQNFEGTWKFKKCNIYKSDVSCYEFTLYLLQTGNNVCGAHFIATSHGPVNPATHQIDDSHEDFGRIGEGLPGSIIGIATYNNATFVIRSGRTGEYYIVRANINNQQMQWIMIGRFTGSEKELSDELLPEKATMTRSLEKFNFVSPDDKPINLKNHCNWPTFQPTFNKVPWSQK